MKISAILPVYNADKYLEECMMSILQQTVSDFELIIVNDGSTDKSLDVIKSFDDDRIKLTSFDHNMGKYSAGPINVGLSKAIGDYITWISADDYLPDKNVFENLLRYLNMHKADLISGAYREIRGDKTTDIGVMDSWLDHDMMKHGNYVCGSFLFKRKCLDIGKLQEDLVGVDDWEYWIRFSKKYKIKKIKDVLYCWRKHGENTTTVLEDLCTKNVNKLLYG